MECPLESGEGAELTIGYVAGTLNAEAKNSFRRHAAHCASCREAIAAQQTVWLALEAWPAVRISEDFDAKLLERIAAEQPSPLRWRGFVRLRWSWRSATSQMASWIASLHLG